MQKEQVSTQTKTTVYCKETDEKILVVKRNILFAYQAIEGLKPIDFDCYQELIQKHKEFLWRSKVEENPEYKQIIPYLVFMYEDKFFVMRRKNNASEARLQNKYSLGIGGHIRKEDLSRAGIIDWSKREFHEEIEYSGTLSIKPLGILNDESNPVGQVHTGFVFLLEGNNNKISIRDEHKEGILLTLDECSELYSSMENWSKIVFDYLKKHS
jgi:predicted NUDIX family phosphoesterase